MATTLSEKGPVTKLTVTLPAEMAAKIEAIAASLYIPVDRAIENLLRGGIEAHEQRRKALFDLFDRAEKATDPAESERLREELAKVVFGE